MIADAGSGITVDAVPRPTLVLTNIPGFSRPSGLAKVAWIWTLRVAGSMSELVAVILPVASTAEPSARTFTTEPFFIPAASCCGTEKFT